MASTVRNLSVLAYANGFTLWHYKAGEDALETVSSHVFFANCADMLTPGDMIMISASDGVAMRFVAQVDQNHVHTAGLK